MSKRPLFVGAGIAALGALALAAPAAAAPYPPTLVPGLVSFSTTTPVAGQPFRATLPDGSCDPGSTVTTTANDVTKGTGEANSAGGFSTSITLTEPGTYTTIMSCTKSGTAVAYSGKVTVKSSGGGSNGGNNGNNSNDLAKTGADNTLTIAAIGGGLILVGGAAVYATRRRERSVR